MKGMSNMDVKVKGVYKHYKGDLYIVEDIAVHSETLEKLVIYRALYGDNKLWARPYDLFVGEYDLEKHIPRFELQQIESKRENYK